MKPPLGLIYAVLIIVAILGVTLYARHQGSTIVAGNAGKAKAQEPASDDVPTEPRNEDASRVESAKDAGDAPK
jgi:hypothetical protein